jgi:hypothetical protein
MSSVGDEFGTQGRSAQARGLEKHLEVGKFLHVQGIAKLAEFIFRGQKLGGGTGRV